MSFSDGMCDRCAVLVRKEWGLPARAAFRESGGRAWRPAFSVAMVVVFGVAAVAFGLAGLPPTLPPVSTVSVAPAPVVASVGPTTQRLIARARAQDVSERGAIAGAGEHHAASDAPRLVSRLPSRSRTGIVRVRARTAVGVEPRGVEPHAEEPRAIEEPLTVVALAHLSAEPMEPAVVFVSGAPAAVELQAP